MKLRIIGGAYDGETFPYHGPLRHGAFTSVAIFEPEPVPTDITAKGLVGEVSAVVHTYKVWQFSHESQNLYLLVPPHWEGFDVLFYLIKKAYS
jgi:hypothetical protein